MYQKFAFFCSLKMFHRRLASHVPDLRSSINADMIGRLPTILNLMKMNFSTMMKLVRKRRKTFFPSL